jgi:hypothetical protein
MSGTYGRVGRLGLDGSDSGTGLDVVRAAIHRSLVGMLTISTEPGRSGGLTPAGLTHSVGVCFLEMYIVARGAKKSAEQAIKGGMPTFVDVKLSLDERNAFSALVIEPAALVKSLQQLVDDGYRVGCAWGNETQSYTVSLTCRDADSPNAGLCMTSFAGDLTTAIALAIFKHRNVTAGKWLGESGGQFGMFG